MERSVEQQEVTQVPKIDLHAHYLPNSYREALQKRGIANPDGFPTPAWDPEMQLSAMRSLNISTSMLSVSSPHVNFGDDNVAKILARKANEEGAALVGKYPDRFGLLASLPLPDVEGSIAEIKYAADVLHADGFAVPTNARGVYLGDPRLDPVLEELNRRKAVIAIHPVGPAGVPKQVAEQLPLPFMEFFFDTTRAVTNMILNGSLRRFPGIRFVVPHAGAFLPLLAPRLSAFTLMMQLNGAKEIPDVSGGLKSLYYDVAGFCVPEQLSVLLPIAGADHLVYGSDYPYTSPPVCAYLADALAQTKLLTDEQRRAIYRDNARKLFPRLKGAEPESTP